MLANRKLMIGTSVKLYCLLITSILLQACALPQQSTTGASRMDVDTADSLNIAEFHRSAKKPPATVAPPVRETSDEQPSDTVARADYQPSKGPAAAYTSIHQTLYKTCPTGWTKIQEWTQPDDGLFYLYVRAICR